MSQAQRLLGSLCIHISTASALVVAACQPGHPQPDPLSPRIGGKGRNQNGRRGRNQKERSIEKKVPILEAAPRLPADIRQGNPTGLDVVPRIDPGTDRKAETNMIFRGTSDQAAQIELWGLTRTVEMSIEPRTGAKGPGGTTILWEVERGQPAEKPVAIKHRTERGHGTERGRHVQEVEQGPRTVTAWFPGTDLDHALGAEGMH